MHDPISVEVPEALAGQRLDRLVAIESGLSRALVGAMIDAGEVTVDGDVAMQRSRRLVVGEVIGFVPPDAPEVVLPLPDASIEFDVLFEDEHVVIIDKPADAIVHPGAGNPAGTLVNGLLHRYPEIVEVGAPDRPGIVHRLDRGTSGAMVVARSAEAYEGLVEALAARQVQRVYWAAVWGIPGAGRGTIDAPIGRSHRRRTAMAVVADGRPAVTHYEVKRRFEVPDDAAILECRLETGRTHQIRVHLNSIGHDIIADDRYGGRHRPFTDLGRLALHARTLGFSHPVDGTWLEFEAPLPQALVDLEHALAGRSS